MKTEWPLRGLEPELLTAVTKDWPEAIPEKGLLQPVQVQEDGVARQAAPLPGIPLRNCRLHGHWTQAGIFRASLEVLNSVLLVYWLRINRLKVAQLVNSREEHSPYINLRQSAYLFFITFDWQWFPTLLCQLVSNLQLCWPTQEPPAT